MRCLRGSWFSGTRLARFEEMVAERVGRRYAVGASSGTGALHMALLALDIGPGDEVITTPFGFVATANAVAYTGARPVFVDIDPVSLNLDPKQVAGAINEKTKAILAVETFGNTTHIDDLAKAAQAHELPLVEDACQAFGGVHRGRAAGSFGRVGVFSFYTNKVVTAGEGGMVVTDDDRMADVCRSLRNHGRPAPRVGDEARSVSGAGAAFLIHERLGFNYRLPEAACALGASQMERLDAMLESRRRVATMYTQRLLDWQDLILPNPPGADTAEVSWFAYVVRLSDLYAQVERDRIIAGLRRHEIGAANYFPPVHLAPHFCGGYGYRKGSFPIAESVSQRTIALPFYEGLDETHVELVTHTLRIMLQREQLLKRD